MLDLTRLFGRDKNSVAYEAGKPIFDTGDLDQVMYVVIEGQVDVVLEDSIL